MKSDIQQQNNAHLTPVPLTVMGSSNSMSIIPTGSEIIAKSGIFTKNTLWSQEIYYIIQTRDFIQRISTTNKCIIFHGKDKYEYVDTSKY